jgi:hypothetical protein
LRYGDRLTDLTRRNRSLRLLRLYKKWNLDWQNSMTSAVGEPIEVETPKGIKSLEVKEIIKSNGVR